MIPTDFSVLLLAWDDADPGMAVLGSAALPPTLPLVYQLAAQHPVLAVYPPLPAPEATAAQEPTTAEADAPPAPETAAFALDDPLAAAHDGPGVHLLPTAEPPPIPTAAPMASSRLVGLDDLRPATRGALPTAHSQVLAPSVRLERSPGQPATSAARPPRSQWPADTLPRPDQPWQAPAAPYAGATLPARISSTPAYATTQREYFPPPPPAPPRPPASAATAPTRAAEVAYAVTEVTDTAIGAAESQLAAQAVPDAAATDAAARPLGSARPAAFDEPVAEMGAAEAGDLHAPENDLVPDEAPSAATPVGAIAEPEGAAAAPKPALSWAVRQPALDGLNFRMIQYARQAAQLVRGQQDFDVIYAPGWPAWLAALEIRNRSGRPLVLYVPALASDSAPAAERGWLLGLERMALRRARLVLVPDADALRRLRVRHAEALGEVRIVPAADEAAVQLVLAEVALG